VHLPIGILLVGLLLHWISKIEKYNNLKHAVPALMLIGAISAALSCISGYLLSLGGEYDGNTLDWHMWMGLGVLGVAIVLCFKLKQKKTDWLYKTFAIGLFVLVSITGHLGGTLTHGSDYLTFAFVNDDLENKTVKVIPDVQKALAYEDIIQPILQNKCYNCHGPNKQKGKFRMDSPESLMKGGKEGEVIVTNNAEESELIRRLLLPIEDKHHMAPEGKDQLTENEIAILHWWIDQGADFGKIVKDIEQSEKTKSILLTFQSDRQEIKSAPIVPLEPVKAANQDDIQKLKDIGIVVLPVAQNSNYLTANFVMVPNAGDKEVGLLNRIKDQLVWLKLGDTKITDTALSTIGLCTNMTQLHLNNTDITDVGIEKLSSLVNLQSLNLVGTKITSKGLKALSNIKGLQSIYFYQTDVDKSSFDELKQLFGKVLLDTGGYVVPTLISDTTFVN